MPKARRKRKHQVEEDLVEGNLEDVPEKPAGENLIDFEKIILASKIIPGGGEGTDSQSQSQGPETTLPISVVRLSDDDLAAHVPQPLREQIQNGSFINLALLLKGSIELQDYASSNILRLNDAGQIESKPRECREKISNIEKWTDAFIIFSGVYLARFPSKANELLHYMFNIRESSKKGGFAWRAYDEQFRLRQAINPSSWAHINTDLWWRCTQNSEPVSHTGQIPSTRKFTCHEYNSGNCRWPNCRFSHTCSSCGGQHPAASCGGGSNQIAVTRSPAANRGRQIVFRGRGRPFFRGARQ